MPTVEDYALLYESAFGKMVIPEDQEQIDEKLKPEKRPRSWLFDKGERDESGHPTTPAGLKEIPDNQSAKINAQKLAKQNPSRYEVVGETGYPRALEQMKNINKRRASRVIDKIEREQNREKASRESVWNPETGQMDIKRADQTHRYHKKGKLDIPDRMAQLAFA